MVSFKFVSVLAAAAPLFAMASADSSSSSSSSIVLIPSPTKTVAASAMSTAGCFATGTPLDDHGPGLFQSSGACQQICLGLGKDVLGLSEGNRCWCGDEFPPLNMRVENSSCSTTCSGTSNDICGGKNKLWVMTTGNTRNPVDFAANITDTSSSSSSAAASATSQSTSTAIATATSSSTPKSSGPNTAGIAAGVVVGVVALAAIIGCVFLWLRQKKRREVEEEYRRQASLNQFVGGGKHTHTSNSSMTDSRLDPDFLARRQSNGSIADNEDYSRRILKVTNA